MKINIHFYIKNKDNPKYTMTLDAYNIQLKGNPFGRRIEMTDEFKEKYDEAWTLSLTPEEGTTAIQLVEAINICVSEYEKKFGVSNILYKITTDD